ncbi:MAG: hypothetical protein RSF34_20365 [Flavobacterium sp.]|uniref:hypothetical protein n=1 Tax=Flavobacterium sp. TaxID=239 RepID=UPI002FCC6D54
MKKQILLLTLFCQLVTFAQTFKGIVKNVETNQPISQITIISEDNTFFVTSNEKGEVVLPENILNQKLFINDYQYEVSEKVFSISENFTWELTPNSETLEEIVIYSDLTKFLEEIIDNSIKSFTRNTSLETYYRENYFENKAIASYAEGIVDFYIDKNTTQLLQLVKQSHVVDFAEVDDFNREVMSTPREVVAASMRFNVIRTLIKDKKKYEIYVTAKQVGDKTIHTCYISPKAKKKSRFLMKGYFTFDVEKKLIYETNYAFDEEKKKYNTTINLIFGKIKIDDKQFQSKYIIGENSYYPSFAKRTIEMITNSKLAKMENVKVHNQAYFYMLKTDVPTNKYSESEKLNGNTLYSRGSIYKTEFWKLPEIINLVE